MIRLVENKIAVEPIWDSDRSPSGLLIIPDEAKERCDQGIVKYIGPDVKDIQVGDYVLFSGYTGTLTKIQDEGFLIIMREEFVTCKIENVGEVEVSGLYFRDKNGEYWTCTYEMVTEFISRAMSERQPVKNIRELMTQKPVRAGA